jgi:FtsP/CotA-like multicopper oxidase with cupredoxin domain
MCYSVTKLVSLRRLTKVQYNLEITNVTRDNLDGSGGSRLFSLINGQYPGPTIRANWGDTVVVNVKNSLQHNGTGLHFHGIRQLNTNQNDGVPGVTECPIAPGKSRTYTFKCTQFGTSWYHSHWSAQYGDGVLGAIQIDGPSTENYDVDLGTLPLSDYYYTPAFEVNEQAQHDAQGAPTPDNIVVNGTHVNQKNNNGKYARISIKKGKSYLLRLINTAVDSTFHVSFDNHPMTVVAADFTPIVPYTTNQLSLVIGKQLITAFPTKKANIGAGQRYNIIIHANQTVDNYWFRVNVGTDGICGGNAMLNSGKVLGAVLQYDGASSTADPTSTSSVVLRTSCDDEDLSNTVPFVPRQVPSNIVTTNDHKINFTSQEFPEQDNLLRWDMDGSSQNVNWNQPTLRTALSGSTNFGNNSNVYFLNNSDWYLWWIQSYATIQIPHPMHLHGHDFWVVGRAANAVWDGTSNGLNFNNPIRRDTINLQTGGYILLAFPADNPGMWLMHCHIAWHASQGFSVQFAERQSEIGSSIGATPELQPGCDAWDAYWPEGAGPNDAHPYAKDDSGI